MCVCVCVSSLVNENNGGSIIWGHIMIVQKMKNSFLENLSRVIRFIEYSPSPEVIKFFAMLNSAEHEIFSTNKYENANKISC